MKNSCGHEVFLIQLHILPGSSGILEGDPETLREITLNSTRKNAERLMGVAPENLHLREPPAEERFRVPGCVFFAEFHRPRLKRGAPGSTLWMAWFAEDLPEDLSAHLAEQLAAADWKKSALLDPEPVESDDGD